MNPPRFLVDEDVNMDLVTHLRAVEPAMELLIIGEAGAPPKGTLDPDVLLAAESLRRALISADKRTMRDHLNDHFNTGHHTWGVILLRVGHSIPAYAADLRLIWFATEADEWVDRTDYIPY
jgi:hypothetical protein